MKLTKRQALEMTRDLWAWLADTGEHYKVDWPGWHGRKMMHDCPCCEFARGGLYLSPGGPGCENCPLRSLWPGKYGCEEKGSPFLAWLEATEEDGYLAMEDRKHYAGLIRDGAIEALAKLDEEERR